MSLGRQVLMMLRRIRIVLSLVPTPLLIGISSSSALYLRNQADLHYRFDVLFPFVLGSVVMLAFGLVVYALSGRHWLRFALTAYYVLGPFYLLFAVLGNLKTLQTFLAPLYHTGVGLALWPILFVAASLVVDKLVSRDSLTKASAVFGMLLLASESLVFWSKFEHPPSETADPTKELETLSPRETSLPNIYHFVMDGFQTDFFEHARTPHTDEVFDGFTFYPSNSGVYHSTTFSLSSVFLGRKYAYDRTRLDYASQMFNGRSSLLYWLKKQGYVTLGFFPGKSSREGRDPFAERQEAELFDQVVVMGAEVSREARRLDEKAFRNLWLYSILPEPLRDVGKRRGWFAGMDEEDLRLLEGERLLPRSAQAVSRMGFETLLEEEAHLPDRGRYTYTHLLIPHWPFNLDARCSFSEGDAKTGPVEQTRCGLLLIERFIETLKDLDRFDDSMILIHGDHGAFFRTSNGSLTPFARSRSLRATLLLKPFGERGGGGLRISERRTSLLDIKPVVMKSVVKAQTRRADDVALDSMDPRGGVTPCIEGETLDSARLILESRGFTLGRIVETRLPSFPPDKIVAQDPPPYAPAGDGLIVNVLLSRGSAQVMPDFIGRQITDIFPVIIDSARNGGLSNARIHYVEQIGFPRGRVVGQSPKPGSKLDAEVEISLYVSKGS